MRVPPETLSVGGAGKATMRMAELAAAALRTLAFDDERNQEAARAAGALPLLTAQLNPVASAQHRGDERKARRENAATAAARAIHALARSNRANQVGLLCNLPTSSPYCTHLAIAEKETSVKRLRESWRCFWYLGGQ